VSGVNKKIQHLVEYYTKRKYMYLPASSIKLVYFYTKESRERKPKGRISFDEFP